MQAIATARPLLEDAASRLTRAFTADWFRLDAFVFDGGQRIEINEVTYPGHHASRSFRGLTRLACLHSCRQYRVVVHHGELLRELLPQCKRSKIQLRCHHNHYHYSINRTRTALLLARPSNLVYGSALQCPSVGTPHAHGQRSDAEAITVDDQSRAARWVPLGGLNMSRAGIRPICKVRGFNPLGSCTCSSQ